MKVRQSILAAVLAATVLPSISWASPPEAVATDPLQTASALEAAGRLGDAWEAADIALATAQGEQRAALEALLQRLGDLTGFLSMRVEPAGAEVFVDGASFGLAPVAALKRVNVGSHEVRVVLAGYEPFQQTVPVAAAGKAIVTATLVRESSVGTVHVVDEGGQPLHVILDGVDVGPTPLVREVLPGKHTIAGAGVDRVANEQEIDVPRGKTLEVRLASRGLVATVRVSTKDGKGVIRLDGAVVGEGSFEGPVRLGVHRLDVTREGHQPWHREVVLHDGEAFAEEVLLEEPPHAAPLDESFVAPRAGWYGGFGFLGSIEPRGAGSELQIGCLDLAAVSCSVSRPTGGGLSFHVGYDFDPIGFELRVAGGADYWTGKAVFDGHADAAMGVSSASPARTENFRFLRAGGTASLQARASWKPSFFLLSAAVGPGVSYRYGALSREASVNDPAIAALFQAPDVSKPKSYLSPALTAEVNLGFKIGSASWLSFGLVGIIENAGNDFRVDPGDSLTGDVISGVAGANAALVPKLPSAAYHIASGVQYMVGPELAFRFGP